MEKMTTEQAEQRIKIKAKIESIKKNVQETEQIIGKKKIEIEEFELANDKACDRLKDELHETQQHKREAEQRLEEVKS